MASCADLAGSSRDGRAVLLREPNELRALFRRQPPPDVEEGDRGSDRAGAELAEAGHAAIVADRRRLSLERGRGRAASNLTHLSGAFSSLEWESGRRQATIAREGHGQTREEGNAGRDTFAICASHQGPFGAEGTKFGPRPADADRPVSGRRSVSRTTRCSRPRSRPARRRRWTASGRTSSPQVPRGLFSGPARRRRKTSRPSRSRNQVLGRRSRAGLRLARLRPRRRCAPPRQVFQGPALPALRVSAFRVRDIVDAAA